MTDTVKKENNFDHIHAFMTEERKRKIFKFDLISNLIVLFSTLLYSFLPILKIGSSSLGNAWQVIGKLFKDTATYSMGEFIIYVQERSVLVFPAFFALFVTLTFAIKTIAAFCLRNNNFYYIRGKQPLVLTIIEIVLALAGAVIYIMAVSELFAWYGFSATSFLIISLVYIAATLSGKIYYQWVVYELRVDYRMLRPKESERSAFNKNRASFMLAYFPSMGTVLLMMTLAMFVLLNYNLTVSQMRNYSGIELPEEGATDMHEFLNDKDMDFVFNYIEEKNVSPKLIQAYSCNYHFYSDFIEDTEKKIMELYPEGSFENALDEYNKTVQALMEDIETAKKMQSRLTYKYEELYRYDCTYEYGSFQFNLSSFIDTTHNAGKETQEKWGMEKDMWHVFCKESIVLSSTKFYTSTNFNKEKIVAYVTYHDGSSRYSIITPENAEELNQASAGIYKLKWSDEWGSYEVDIQIEQGGLFTPYN